MSLYAQTLLAQAREEFRNFKGAAERALIREKGKCARQHCAWAAARLNETIRVRPRAVAAVLVEMFPPKKKILFPESLFTPKAQQKNGLSTEIKPLAPARSKMPALSQEQKRLFKS